MSEGLFPREILGKYPTLVLLMPFDIELLWVLALEDAGTSPLALAFKMGLEGTYGSSLAGTLKTLDAGIWTKVAISGIERLGNAALAMISGLPRECAARSTLRIPLRSLGSLP